MFGGGGAAQARAMQQPPPQPIVPPLSSSQPNTRAQVPQFLSPQVYTYMLLYKLIIWHFKTCYDKYFTFKIQLDRFRLLIYHVSVYITFIHTLLYTVNMQVIFV